MLNMSFTNNNNQRFLVQNGNNIVQIPSNNATTTIIPVQLQHQLQTIANPNVQPNNIYTIHSQMAPHSLTQSPRNIYVMPSSVISGTYYLSIHLIYPFI